ncbi:MAG: right-handed parallel beta-helix repeat-containing protein [Candidatus Thorarchaeota archaeon]
MNKGKRKQITQVMLIAVPVFILCASVVSTAWQVAPLGATTGTNVLAYTSHAAIHIDGNADFIGQAAAEAWPGNGTESAPFLITGYYFYDLTHSLEIWNVDLHWAFVGNEVDGPYSSNVWCSIEIDNCTNGIVTDNLFHHRFRGVWLVDIANVVVANNTIQDNLSQGIECVGYANNCLIADNYITRCDGSGIRLQMANGTEISDNVIEGVTGSGIQILATSTDCVITNNDLSDLGAMGVLVGPSSNTQVTDNHINNATGAGVYLQASTGIEVCKNTVTNGSDDGMRLKGISFGLVQNNTVSVIEKTGVRVESGENSTFRFNTIQSCGNYGLETDTDSRNMTITLNTFMDNGGVESQVCDDGVGNVYVFNYYDEWTLPDADLDQIVDNPYALDGGSSNEDPSPLADPNAVPPTASPRTSNPPTGPVTQEMLILAAGGVTILVIVGVLLKKR